MENKSKRPASTDKNVKEKKAKLDVVKKIKEETNSLPESRIFPSSKEIETKEKAISNEAYLIRKYNSSCPKENFDWTCKNSTKTAMPRAPK